VPCLVYLKTRSRRQNYYEIEPNVYLIIYLYILIYTHVEREIKLTNYYTHQTNPNKQIFIEIHARKELKQILSNREERERSLLYTSLEYLEVVWVDGRRIFEHELTEQDIYTLTHKDPY